MREPGSLRAPWRGDAGAPPLCACGAFTQEYLDQEETAGDLANARIRAAAALRAGACRDA